jgi:molybdopterin-guanine dinucleotide biosynthesis protein A
MRTLGAIIAGGTSRRFGSDKALAEIDGIRLIDRVASALRVQCDALVIVGRASSHWPSVEDLPHPGLGPLGGLAGALGHAARIGFDQVLTSGCDLPDVPAQLRSWLDPAPAVITGQPLLGLWPSHMATGLLDHLATSSDRSMRRWIAVARARQVAPAEPVANINSREDLDAYLAAREDRA